MVRGRRTRRAASSATVNGIPTTQSGQALSPSAKSGSLSPIHGTKAAGHSPLAQQNGAGVKVLSAKGAVVLVDDFCCASPKRKEYKIDELLIKNGTAQNGFATEVTVNHNNNHTTTTTTSPTKSRMVLRGTQNTAAHDGPVTNGRLCPVAGNEITRFLLSQSKSKSKKTRKKSPNFELVNDDTCDSFTHATSLQEVPMVNGVVKMEAEEEEQAANVKAEAVEVDAEEGAENTQPNLHPFQMFGRLPIGNGMVAADNIFLQEPVLKLTVDEAACVLVQPKTEEGSARPRNQRKGSKGSQGAAVALLNQDSNSGDSGVVIDKVVSHEAPLPLNGDTVAVTPKPLVTSASRPRVPTTPHRILCPSSPQVNGAGEHAKEEGIAAEREEEDVPMTNRKLDLEDDVEIKAEHQAQEDRKSGQPLASGIKEESTMKAPKGNGVMPKPAPANHQSTMEDFFKVRRSVRKTKKEVEREEQLAIEKAILSECDVGLAVKMFDNKGRGIVATRPFSRGEFVVEYVGEFISIAEANRREKLYAQDQNTGCYMYYFKHKNKQYCIDATEETGKLGRLVNHSRNGNLMTRTVEVNGQPHLVLIAKEDIEEGRELNYDYGDRSKESLLHHPWLAY